MKLQVRKLIESDWNVITKWYEQYEQPMPDRDFYPENGLGGFMVYKGKTLIAAMFLYVTNSKTAIPAIVISNKDYKDNDRSDALQLLVDFTKDFAKELDQLSEAERKLVLEKSKVASQLLASYNKSI